MARQTLELQHIDIFYEKGSILFHDLFSLQKVAEYQKVLSSLSPSHKRNIWQHSPLLKNLCFNHQLGHLAADLSRLKPLRFAFDHYFPSFKELITFFSENTSLNDLSSIDGLEIALLLNLSSSIELTSESRLPLLSGSGMFFDTNFCLNASSDQREENLLEGPFPEDRTPEGPFLLIAYCKANARYIFKPSDPFTHDVKKEKCAFGDLVSNIHHPVVHY
jgi:hypothetical protein